MDTIVDTSKKRERDEAIPAASAATPEPKRRKASVTGRPKAKKSAYQFFKLGPGKQFAGLDQQTTVKEKTQSIHAARDELEKKHEVQANGG